MILTGRNNIISCLSRSESSGECNFFEVCNWEKGILCEYTISASHLASFNYRVTIIKSKIKLVYVFDKNINIILKDCVILN